MTFFFHFRGLSKNKKFFVYIFREAYLDGETVIHSFQVYGIFQDRVELLENPNCESVDNNMLQLSTSCVLELTPSPDHLNGEVSFVCVCLFLTYQEKFTYLPFAQQILRIQGLRIDVDVAQRER